MSKYFSVYCLLLELLEHMFRKGLKYQAVAEDGAGTPSMGCCQHGGSVSTQPED